VDKIKILTVVVIGNRTKLKSFDFGQTTHSVEF